MSCSVVAFGAYIVIGGEWRQQVQVTADAAVFPSGATFTSQVRSTVPDTNILDSLTTANGGLTRISDSTIEILLTASQTATLVEGAVVLDIARTDLSSPRYVGFALTVPVVQPVTRF